MHIGIDIRGENCNQQVDDGVYKGALHANIMAGIVAKKDARCR